jgi:hypothetical protein
MAKFLIDDVTAKRHTIATHGGEIKGFLHFMD